MAGRVNSDSKTPLSNPQSNQRPQPRISVHPATVRRIIQPQGQEEKNSTHRTVVHQTNQRPILDQPVLITDPRTGNRYVLLPNRSLAQRAPQPQVVTVYQQPQSYQQQQVVALLLPPARPQPQQAPQPSQVPSLPRHNLPNPTQSNRVQVRNGHNQLRNQPQPSQVPPVQFAQPIPNSSNRVQIGRGHNQHRNRAEPRPDGKN